jgi:hypothetical protein
LKPKARSNLVSNLIIGIVVVVAVLVVPLFLDVPTAREFLLWGCVLVLGGIAVNLPKPWMGLLVLFVAILLTAYFAVDSRWMAVTGIFGFLGAAMVMSNGQLLWKSSRENSKSLNHALSDEETLGRSDL